MSASDNVAAMSLLYTTSIKSLQDSLAEYKRLKEETEVGWGVRVGRVEEDERESEQRQHHEHKGDAADAEGVPSEAKGAAARGEE